MSEENDSPSEEDRGKLVSSVFDAVDRRDLDAVMALVHPDAEFHSRLAASEGRVYKGREGVRNFFRDVDEAFDEVHRGAIEIVGMRGENVVLVSRIAGTGRGSGIPIEVERPQVWTFRDGKPWRSVVYDSIADALEAAGLSE